MGGDENGRGVVGRVWGRLKKKVMEGRHGSWSGVESDVKGWVAKGKGFEGLRGSEI